MLEQSNNRRKNRKLVAVTATILPVQVLLLLLHYCICRQEKGQPFVDSLILWRSSKLRFGKDQFPRRLLLQRLFDTVEEADWTPKNQAFIAAGPEELLVDNQELREKVESLEEEIRYLRAKFSTRIVLESFEGENRLVRVVDGDDDDENIGNSSTEHNVKTTTSFQMDETGMWCDELEDEACPVEPMISFGEALRDRALWLVGLLMLQSFSGIILSHNEALLTRHPVIIYYLTMLVGAGGNAGNQASVRVIRGLALGTLNEKTQGQFIARELKMAFSLSAIMSLAGFLRAMVSRTPLAETVAVTSSLAMIVLSSVCLGAVLPIGLKKIGIDPAHSSTSIQVVMDILGVVLAVVVSSFLLDSHLGRFLVARLIGSC